MSSSEDAPSLEPDGPYVSFVRQRRSAILERLGDACARAGRDVASVTLAAVSKTVGPVEAVAAMRAGYEVFAENRPQELVRKLGRRRHRGATLRHDRQPAEEQD